MTTAPETEAFDLTTPETVYFRVPKDSTQTPPVIDTNSPTTTQSLLNFNQFNPSLGVLTRVTISFASEYTLGPSLSVTFLPDTVDLDPIEFILPMAASVFH